MLSKIKTVITAVKLFFVMRKVKGSEKKGEKVEF